jgi:hypothetical protein
LNRAQGLFRRFLPRSDATTVFLDMMPFNRFLLHVASNMIYVFSMLSSIASPLIMHQMDNQEIAYHGFLAIYPVSLLIKDLGLFVKIFATFW